MLEPVGGAPESPNQPGESKQTPGAFTEKFMNVVHVGAQDVTPSIVYNSRQAVRESLTQIIGVAEVQQRCGGVFETAVEVVAVNK